MAKKGQKFNKYTVELRQEVVQRYLNGEGSPVTLGEEYNIPYKTIRTWIFAYKKQIPIGQQKRGRPKNNDNIDYKERYEILKKYRAFIAARREKK